MAWGNKDRDILTLNYKVDFGSGIVLETSDQFVAQTRGKQFPDTTKFQRVIRRDFQHAFNPKPVKCYNSH